MIGAKDRHLPLHANRCAGDQRLAFAHAVAVDQRTGLEIVARVDDEIGGGDWGAQLGEIEVHQLPADEGGGGDGLIVQWLDLSCPDDVAMTIDASARAITVAAQSCPVDAVGSDHGVWLDFSVDVPADEVTVDLLR